MHIALAGPYLLESSRIDITLEQFADVQEEIKALFLIRKL